MKGCELKDTQPCGEGVVLVPDIKVMFLSAEPRRARQV